MNMNPTPLTLTFYKSLGITRHKSLYIQICAYLHVNHTYLRALVGLGRDDSFPPVFD